MTYHFIFFTEYDISDIYIQFLRYYNSQYTRQRFVKDDLYTFLFLQTSVTYFRAPKKNAEKVNSAFEE
jgi:hypothetical protein